MTLLAVKEAETLESLLIASASPKAIVFIDSVAVLVW